MTIFAKGSLGGRVCVRDPRGFVGLEEWGLNTTLTDEVEVLSALKKNSTCRNDATFELFLPTKQAS